MASFFDRFLKKIEKLDNKSIKRVLEKIAHENDFLEKIFDSLAEGLIVLSAEGTIKYLNSSATKLFGLEQNKIIGEKIFKIVNFLSENDFRKDYSSFEAVKSAEIEILYPENKILNYYLSPIIDKATNKTKETNGKIYAYILLVRDLTYKRKFDKQIIESEKLSALTMLSANVAHELGNPLNSLDIHLQIIEKKLKTRHSFAYEDIKDMLDVSRSEIKRLDLIISKFLRSIRPSELNFQLLDLNKIVLQAVSFLEHELDDRNIKTVFDLHSALPLLQLDKDRVTQAIYNILRNSMQAINSDEGRIIIKTDLSKNGVKLTFRDNGIGISSENMGKVFSSSTFSTKNDGSGLGLLITNRIMNEHGGYVHIQSQEKNGTSISLNFPNSQNITRILTTKKDN